VEIICIITITNHCTPF